MSTAVKPISIELPDDPASIIKALERLAGNTDEPANYCRYEAAIDALKRRRRPKQYDDSAALADVRDLMASTKLTRNAILQRVARVRYPAADVATTAERLRRALLRQQKIRPRLP